MIFFPLWLCIAALPMGVRTVTATSCDIIRLNIALGMTSQIVFDEVPVLTLHADEEHIKVKSSPDIKRSIAVIPFVDSATVSQLMSRSELTSAAGKDLARRLDDAFRTNLFVFFKNSNQLMFELRFVDKRDADYILNIKQSFRKECPL